MNKDKHAEMLLEALHFIKEGIVPNCDRQLEALQAAIQAIKDREQLRGKVRLLEIHIKEFSCTIHCQPLEIVREQRRVLQIKHDKLVDKLREYEKIK